MNSFIEDIFKISDQIRYVAIYQDGTLTSRVASELKNASSSDTDKYEELLVNPAILLLTNQRGNIDCGGLKFILVRYGNFFQFVCPIREGHVSVCIAAEADPLALVESIQERLKEGLGR